MKSILSIFAVLISILGYGQINKKELLVKHWAGNCADDSCKTILFTAYKKYDPKLYQWGGNMEGKEFFKDSTSTKYYNVFCSDETDPKQLFTAKWWWKKDTLIIDSDSMTEIYQALRLTKKEMLLKLISLEAKKVEMIPPYPQEIIKTH